MLPASTKAVGSKVRWKIAVRSLQANAEAAGQEGREDEQAALGCITHLRAFLIVWCLIQGWCLLGAATFAACEQPHAELQLQRRAIKQGRFEAIVARYGLNDTVVDDLREWFQDFEDLGGGWTPNTWDFYNSYLFCLTITAFNGLWYFEPATSGGKLALVLWGAPALVIGVMGGMVMARVLYLALFNHLRVWSCFSPVGSMWERARLCEASFSKWRDQVHFTCKYLLLILLLILTIHVPLTFYLIDNAVENDKDPGDDFKRNSLGENLYFSFQWVTTIGVGEFRLDAIFGSTRLASVLVVQVLILVLWVALGSAFRLFDFMGEKGALLLGLSHIVGADEEEETEVGLHEEDFSPKRPAGEEGRSKARWEGVRGLVDSASPR